MEFIVFCIIIGAIIYSTKNEVEKKQKKKNSRLANLYSGYNNSSKMSPQNNSFVELEKVDVTENELLSTFIPSAKTKYKDCIKFVSNKLKFKYLVCGDFYFIQNSNTVINEPNVFDYWLYASVDNKSFREITRFKTKRGITVQKLDESYDNWILMINRITKLSKNNGNQCCYYDSKTKLHIFSNLDIYYNGKLLKTLINYHTAPKVNRYGEILYKTYKNGRGSNILNIFDNSIKTVIKNVNSNELNNTYEVDFKHFPELEYTMYDENDNVCIYFYKKECDSFYVACEFCKNADEFLIIPNKFKDDVETINYCAKYKKDRICDIGFLLFSLDRTHNGRSAFSAGLYGDKSRSNTCGGNAVYKIAIMDFYKGLEGKYASMNEDSQHFLTHEQKQNFKSLIKTVHEKYGFETDYSKLPQEFLNNLVAEDLMYKKLHEFILPYINRTINIPSFALPHCDIIFPCENPIWNGFDAYRAEMKAKYNEMKQSLIEQGIIRRKWKSEIELFRTVYSIYPDCIYQYRTGWLGLQSIDIFIPSLNIGIEYQGLQHYEPVEIFGGEEGYKYRKKLDKQKSKLCREHNIKLIEWKYDESISKLILDKKIKDVNEMAVEL